MKLLNKFSREFFDKYSDKPVKLLPYSSEMQSLADKYIKILSETFKGIDIKIQTIGSVAYKIPTSDVEIALYVKNNNRENVLKILEEEFGKPQQNEKEFVRFEIAGEEFEFDIHIYFGYEGEVSEKLTRFMLNNPRLIDEYKTIKEKFCFSRKEYQLNKNTFLNKVIEAIPDNY
ncbi:MAG: hypothetical protein WCK48_02190 [bacterium]